MQASFMYNETAVTWKASIHDFFLANTMHDFLYSICGTKCGRFSPCNSIRKAAISHAKQKRQGFHPYRLTFIFSQRRRHDYHMAFSLLESVHRIISPASSLSGKLLHPRKTKRYSFHPYRLTFIFSQRRWHGYHRAFSLLEFVRRIAPPMRTHGK